MLDLNNLITEAKQEAAEQANATGNRIVHHWLYLVLENKLPREYLYKSKKPDFEQEALWARLAVVIHDLPKEELNGDIFHYTFEVNDNTKVSYVGWAARNEYFKILEVLLAAGADPNGYFNGKPAIWLAVSYVCTPACLKLLIRYGAKCPMFMLGNQELKFDLRWLFHGFRDDSVPSLMKILNKNASQFERRTWQERSAMEAQYYEAKCVTFV